MPAIKLKKHLTIFLLFGILFLHGQDIFPQKYFLFFTDKDEQNINKSTVTDISSRALERRRLRGVTTGPDWYDLPVKPEYVERIREKGIPVIHVLRWFNAVSAEIQSEQQLREILALPFVKSVRPVRVIRFKKPEIPEGHSFFKYHTPEAENLLNPVIRFIDADSLVNSGKSGKQVRIAVFDTGFELKNPLFKNISTNLLGYFDFVDPNGFNPDSTLPPGELYHGTFTASIIGGILDSASWYYRGLAPDAQFLLCRTEHVAVEVHAEEDNWAAAAETAEQQGVDIVSSSLGYSEFDPGEGDYTYADMDGKSTIVTQAANILTQKGVIVVVSAGNEGASSWKYITAPADGFDVISVGAIRMSDSAMASFSSYGPTYDGRVKPEIVAPGVLIPGANLSGYSSPIINLSGTSAACPVVAGGIALLLEEFPQASVQDIRQALIETADASMIKGITTVPGDQYGYGVVRVDKMVAFLRKKFSGDTLPPLTKNFTIFPNPIVRRLSQSLIIRVNPSLTLPVEIHVYNSLGQKVTELSMNQVDMLVPSNSLEHLPSGLYIFEIRGTFGSFHHKVLIF